MKPVYRVYDKKTGEIVCSGTSRECAEIIGCKAIRISTIRLKEDSRKFRVFRAGEYPCGICKMRAICDEQDTVCTAWNDWFQEVWEAYRTGMRNDQKSSTERGKL